MRYLSKKSPLSPLRWIYLTLVSLVLILLSLPAMAAEPEVAVKDTGYAAKYVSQSVPDPIVLAAGETKSVAIKFKNTGTTVWNSSGSRFISAYTMEPRYRASEFRGRSWLSAGQTGKLAGITNPGQTGELIIDLVAPSKPGDYTERFYLAAENHTWVKGGYFYLQIKVTAATAKPAPPLPSDLPANVPADSVSSPQTAYRASRFILSRKAVTAVGGEQVKIVVGFQNTGTAAWPKYTLVPGGATALASVSPSFADSAWQGRSLVLAREGNIGPGSILRETFLFRAPRVRGSYTASFELKANDAPVEGGAFSIPVTVTEDAPTHYADPIFPGEDAVEPPAETPRLSAEPRIRVGLYKPDATVQFVSYDDDYNVYDGTDLVGVLEKNKVGFLSFADGQYSFKGGGMEFATGRYIRLEPAADARAVFTLLNYSREVSWKGSRNFNAYRGAIEYRLTKDGSTLYVINDLLLEDYVNGIGENANSSPLEYLKSQAVAQRTYAYYIKEQSSKHDTRNFDVVATTGDQLYLGYESERIMPRFVESAKATRGYMVTYDNDIVITPYFGNTGGRTLSWTEVWGGSHKPWLVSVPATYDKRDGKRLYGHGVGMSQRDAAIRAEEEGLDWVALIKYYYSGVEVAKIFS
ncbi:MAG: SpoIID/LytB domain protein [Candidatus Magasanikbacteria bacterium GW2011_GWA2_56_11]|uniref:SpoIID/LytB domain protein n=1 Tax=Candidatus Magasanikbacteria bacterium GW2011_GWA2_56_11 TaxID=1619044 RepID=A0A0G2AN88_9BACT|nr:MAG: SpoIID/LytB domain protein [Candidatus Magasanikbacteria bacterium GW2011_GWA2_56_11]